MVIEKNYDLINLNTFGVKARAKFFAVLEKEADILALFESEEFKKNKNLFLGGGSNVLFTKDFEGIVILNKLKGIEVLAEDEKNVTLKIMGGEIWHDAVLFAVEKNYWGVENLSLIPGTVGAAPMQNIGAYGAELKDVLESVEAYEIENGKKRVFDKQECRLGYRDSIFKNELKEKYFISAITLQLNKVPNPNISYKILKDYLDSKEKKEISELSLKNISEAVSDIRRSKLPDPKIIGNAGSFFKNVFVSKEEADKLLSRFPEMPVYIEESNLVKIPSAWLIEQSGPADGASWKGHKEGNAGVHHKQALVLVNHGGATGEEIVSLSRKIIASVREKFGLQITPEVNII